ncbi:MAG TPA: VWA domain-containing protein [Vicinamibacteria bacterium]|nr:VWA domain-containing protein [Vicinamibacteria bacterium]
MLGVAVALSVAAAVPCAPSPGPPVFRASVESVYVDVFVSRQGQPVPGLQASNFELKDNGVRQVAELLVAEAQPLRSVLVFDTSSSLVGERLAALKDAGKAFLDGLRPEDQVALVGFSEEIAWLAPSTADKTAVRRALDNLEAAGTTAAFDALYAAVALSEPAGRSLIVLFTDGEDNMSVLSQKQLVTMVERSNALVHTVGWREPGVTSEPGLITAEITVPNQALPSLRQIAEVTGGRFWWADSPEQLRRAFAEIADSMSRRYILRYEAQGVKREGWHRIEIKLRGQKGDLQARHGYWVAPPRETEGAPHRSP